MNMVQMELGQGEVPMELDLVIRGSEASMADSLGIKDDAKESSKGQNANVHGALGIHPNATMEGNVAGFKGNVVGFKPMGNWI